MPKSIFDPRYIEIIARLRAAREHLGLSQAEVATRLGKPQPYVAKVETCERRIDLLETLELCSALGIGLEAILPLEFRGLLNADGQEAQDA